MTLANIVVGAAGVYLLLGVVLVPWWWARGLRRLDEAAGAASWSVRLILAPGLVMLWPALLRRGIRGNGHPPPEHNAHRDAARAHHAPS